MGPGPILARGIVRGHRRDDGWLPLARAAMRAVDPDGGFYSSPVTQVPADVLAVLPLAPYVSRACQTGRAVLAAGPELDGLLTARGLGRESWAGEFFKSCRETEKWTGLDCQDPQHQAKADGQAAPVIPESPVYVEPLPRTYAWRCASEDHPSTRWGSGGFKSPDMAQHDYAAHVHLHHASASATGSAAGEEQR
jgi:hypothetical protein